MNTNIYVNEHKYPKQEKKIFLKNRKLYAFISIVYVFMHNNIYVHKTLYNTNKVYYTKFLRKSTESV